jgi:hypothetical protein
MFAKLFNGSSLSWRPNGFFKAFRSIHRQYKKFFFYHKKIQLFQYYEIREHLAFVIMQFRSKLRYKSIVSGFRKRSEFFIKSHQYKHQKFKHFVKSRGRKICIRKVVCIFSMDWSSPIRYKTKNLDIPGLKSPTPHHKTNN